MHGQLNVKLYITVCSVVRYLFKLAICQDTHVKETKILKYCQNITQ